MVIALPASYSDKVNNKTMTVKPQLLQRLKKGMKRCWQPIKAYGSIGGILVLLSLSLMGIYVYQKLFYLKTPVQKWGKEFFSGLSASLKQKED